ncbi:Multiple coagulation factor deficiency protein 2 -like protein [Halotydeus destructor]|nr:Multiple coagulation factor deficiency protein 2 -like protein [Halotydeus destructor]
MVFKSKGSLIAVVYTSLYLVTVNGQYQQQQQPQMGQPQQQQFGQQAHPNQPGFGQPAGGHVDHNQVQPGQNILHDNNRIHDREHLKEHLHGVVSEPDVSKMSEEELQFHYFKMHDNDNNNKLDGCELIKSLIHWHVEESKHLGANAPPTGTTKLFNDGELSQMIDPILEMDDRNRDGFIDYPEFVAAQKSRGF